MVSWLTRSGCAHRMRSHGCGLSGPDTQVVAGLPSKADRAWSSGSAVYAEEARTQVVPPNLMYRRTSLVEQRHRRPAQLGPVRGRRGEGTDRSRTGPRSAWLSAGEHTQRCEVRMQPLGSGSVLASTTALASPLRPER